MFSGERGPRFAPADVTGSGGQAERRGDSSPERQFTVNLLGKIGTKGYRCPGGGAWISEGRLFLAELRSNDGVRCGQIKMNVDFANPQAVNIKVMFEADSGLSQKNEQQVRVMLNQSIQELNITGVTLDARDLQPQQQVKGPEVSTATVNSDTMLTQEQKDQALSRFIGDIRRLFGHVGNPADSNLITSLGDPMSFMDYGRSFEGLVINPSIAVDDSGLQTCIQNVRAMLTATSYKNLSGEHSYNQAQQQRMSEALEEFNSLVSELPRIKALK